MSKKNVWWNVANGVSSVIGGVVGGIVGSAVPGIGTAAGAKIGAVAGNGSTKLVRFGFDKDYRKTYRSKDGWKQGIVDTVDIVASGVAAGGVASTAKSGVAAGAGGTAVSAGTNVAGSAAGAAGAGIGASAGTAVAGAGTAVAGAGMNVAGSAAGAAGAGIGASVGTAAAGAGMNMAAKQVAIEAGKNTVLEAGKKVGTEAITKSVAPSLTSKVLNVGYAGLQEIAGVTGKIANENAQEAQKVQKKLEEERIETEQNLANKKDISKSAFSSSPMFTDPSMFGMSDRAKKNNSVSSWYKF